MACLEGRLNEVEICQDNKTRVCVVGASRGYPNDYSSVKGKRIYGLEKARGMKGVEVFGAGYSVSGPSKEDFKNRHVLAMVNMGPKLNTSLIVAEFRGKLPEVENWEQELYDAGRESGTNVIRVQNPNHVRSALDRHTQLYGEQFHELAERFINLFQGFIGEHPGFGKY